MLRANPHSQEIANPARRNVAIVAHVDHGKTTLVDALLHQSGIFRSNERVAERVMDSNELERERGITILAKNTAVHYDDHLINIVDTPGHADFGGEVERTLSMVDGIMLLVDASEGPLPQTRFVLRKALERRLTPIVVINKIDRSDARTQDVLNEVYDLFIDLDATEDQLDFPVLYTNAREGTATTDLAVPGVDLRPLFDAVIDAHSAAARVGHRAAPGARRQSRLERLPRPARHRPHLQRPREGRRSDRRLQDRRLDPADDRHQALHVRGPQAHRRDRGRGGRHHLPGRHREHHDRRDHRRRRESRCAIETIAIDEPTVSMIFGVNTSPFAGRDGQFVTSRQIKDRLDKELVGNVSIRVEPTETPEQMKVIGRGELQLSILIEMMRREGYEMQVSRPEIVITRDQRRSAWSRSRSSSSTSPRNIRAWSSRRSACAAA